MGGMGIRGARRLGGSGGARGLGGQGARESGTLRINTPTETKYYLYFNLP